jgi:hypothetical protein
MNQTCYYSKFMMRPSDKLSIPNDQVVCCLSVQIGHSNKGTIEVRAGDDAAHLAEEFAKEHGLSMKKQLKIEELLKHNCLLDHSMSAASLSTTQLPHRRGLIAHTDSKEKHNSTFKSNPVSRLSSPDSVRPVYTDRLIKKEKLAQQVWRERLKECRFVPQVNVSRQPTRSESRHLKLYQDAYKLMIKKEQLADEVPVLRHYPKINKDILRESKAVRMERLYNSHLRTQEKIVQVIEDQKRLLSHEFRPNTGRSPKLRNPHQLPIGEYLHSSSGMSSPKIRSTQPSPRTFRPSLNSNKFARNRFLKFYQDLFERLDPDASGTISKTCLTSKLRDIERLVLTLAFEGVETQLDFTGFVSKVHFTVSSLDIQTRSDLLKKPPLTPTVVSVKSVKARVDVHARQTALQAATTAKLAMARHIRDQAGLAECTFSPKTTFYPTRKQRELMRNKSK